ncbi:MAG TPA: hypothetical protein VJT71_12345, partial [Pyrinomonadaceae bacterium]|nr:hypothetical protein [Pyrinomonadaceae bacterium]
GAKTAASLINRHGHTEQFPAGVLTEENRALALLFKELATLRTDAPLFSPTTGSLLKSVEDMRWRGPRSSFASMARKIDAERLIERVKKLERRKD